MPAHIPATENDSLDFSDVMTLADLGQALHRLRRRLAVRQQLPVMSSRNLEAITGYSRSAINEYFNGTRLPPTDKLDVVAMVLEASKKERRALAAGRDGIEGKCRKLPSTPVAGPAGHAFISYVHEDACHVDQLQRDLEAAGVSVWRDTADLWPGEDWRMKIRHAITDNALVFIACFSSQSIARAKSYQNEELTLAIEQLRMRRPDVPWLIPIRFDDCSVPDLEIGGARSLASIQRADLFGEHRNAGIRRLLITAQRLLRQHASEQDARENTSPRLNAPSGLQPSHDPRQKRSAATLNLADDGAQSRLAARRLKQALPHPSRRVEVTDLVDREIQRLDSRIADTTRHPTVNVPFASQLTAYEEDSKTSAYLLATGVFYGDETYTPLWIRSLRRLMSVRRPITGIHDGQLEAIRHYPALLCLWAMGLGAILSDHENLLSSFLLEPTWTSFFYEDQEPAVLCLNANRIVLGEPTSEGKRWLYPQSHHVRAASRDILSQIEPDNDTYQQACDRLEYLASLIAMDTFAPNGSPWAGEFITRGRYHDKDPKLGKLLAGGAFGGDPERAQTAREALNTWITQHQSF